MSDQTVEDVIIGLVQELIEDWGLDDIAVTRDTTLKGDMGFESADTMQIFTAIVEHYRGVDFKFQHLVMKDNKFVDDLTVGQIVVFVIKKLQEA